MKGNFLTNYVKSSLEELSKVTWPTKNQAVRLTIIVFVFCVIFALFMGFMDLVFNEGYKYIINSNF